MLFTRVCIFLMVSLFGANSVRAGDEYLAGSFRPFGVGPCGTGTFWLRYLLPNPCGNCAADVAFSLPSSVGHSGEFESCSLASQIDPYVFGKLTNGIADWLFVVGCTGGSLDNIGRLESTWGLGNPDLAGHDLSRICLRATPAGSGGGWTAFEFRFYAFDHDRPPVVVASSTDQTVACGVSAEFSVLVDGTSPFSFQWYRDAQPLSNAPGISGAHSAILSIASAGLGDAGLYKVAVANAFGSVLTAAGRLSVEYIADYNHSGVLSVQDLFDYLASYFAGEFRADINETGTLTVQDIFDFLAAYFRGC